ncbi:putative pinene synthase [Malus sylvestris]|uniref:putative pinene synthase n=1 Tax=Malus sylvestris TaxID=3752 RepID=UPI0021ABBEF0|nr:putative pinene synthase [Malus sylvestris]
MQRELGELKVVVSNEVLTTRAGDFSQQLKLIDAIQRLGVVYHFEREIREVLEGIHNAAYDDNSVNDDGDLYNVALRFRLLRQHGFNVSYDTLQKFKCENGSFNESLIADVPGMLGLYEATHLMVHGEDILEEAHVFITTHLKSTATSVSYVRILIGRSNIHIVNISNKLFNGSSNNSSLGKLLAKRSSEVRCQELHVNISRRSFT